jgi:hypothetical protein
MLKSAPAASTRGLMVSAVLSSEQMKMVPPILARAPRGQ